MRPTRRSFLNLSLGASVAGLASSLSCDRGADTGRGSGPSSNPDRPNVLFIASDDLNDWVGCLGGHPNAHTPNLDRLAARGTLFTNAHCTGTACSPSRTSVLTGRQPYTSGVYTNNHNFRDRYPDLVTLPQAFMESGYRVTNAGKMYHYSDPGSWHELHHPQQEDLGAYRADDGFGLQPNGKLGGFRFGPVHCGEEKFHDHMLGTWVEDAFATKIEPPFFFSVGIFLPHVPWYVPPSYLEQFPYQELSLPKIYLFDRADLSRVAKRSTRSDRHRWITRENQYRQALSCFLGTVALMDATLGRVLDALEASPWADNTIIVFWSDHGFHLGEKNHWSKYTLWEDTTRVPLIISAPGTSTAGTRSTKPVSLVDLYPTLLDLCGLPAQQELDGASLRPLLSGADSDWDRPAITTAEIGQSVRTERWRYIRYHAGGEELYDHDADEHEWINLLTTRPNHTEIRDELAAMLPTTFAEALPKSTRETSETDVM